MTTKRMKSPFGSVSVLFVVLTVMLAMGGLIWAHWFTSLNVDANINTGNVGIQWTDVWTNDDGKVDAWDAGDNGSNGMFTHWFEGSSVDPADFGDERYDKDVGACWAGGGDGELWVQLENGYPSYHCLVTAGIRNYGSVPIKAMPSTWVMERGYYECNWYYDPEFVDGPLPRSGDDESEFVDFDMNGEFTDGDVRVSWDADGPYIDSAYDGVFNDDDVRLFEDCVFFGEELAAEDLGDGQIGWGYYEGADFIAEVTGFLPDLFGCGVQIDPGFDGGTEFGFHVEQPAMQNATYHFSMHQEFVNWNEFDDGWCEPPPEPIRVWSSLLNFSSTGWGGWSCPATHPDAINAGVSKVSGSEVAPDYPIEVRVAEPGMAAFDGYDYPTFPHYTYPSNEEGAAAHNGGTGQSVYLWVDCLP